MQIIASPLDDRTANYAEKDYHKKLKKTGACRYGDMTSKSYTMCAWQTHKTRNVLLFE